ncbi:MAG TPA: hypothetical protein VFX17_02580 [Patescibacteria group bacterium]|nr:hypothetical protein [Patescibacteria group bacterium]
MTTDKNSLKFIFGLIIFMFSLALAYFTASYLSKAYTIDYWGALLIFGVVYIVIGIIIYQVYAVSLGFLFAASVLVLHLLLENFGNIPSPAKTLIIGAVLVVLYLVAWEKLDETQSDNLPPTPPPTSPVN